MQKNVTIDDVMRIIDAGALCRGSIDDHVVRRGAELIAAGCLIDAEAFAQLTMFLDPDSPVATPFHRFALERYGDDHTAWHWIGQIARIGTPLKHIANDSCMRLTARAARESSYVDYFTHAFVDPQLWGVSLRDLRHAVEELPGDGEIAVLLVRLHEVTCERGATEAA